MTMIFYLLVVFLLGLLIGWLLAKSIQSKKHSEEVDHLHHTIEDKNKLILQLEKVYDGHHQLEQLLNSNLEYKKTIKAYQNTIAELKEELKFYSMNGEEDEFIISKDQFIHIEQQLIEYQKEIKALKKGNQRHSS